MAKLAYHLKKTVLPKKMSLSRTYQKYHTRPLNVVNKFALSHEIVTYTLGAQHNLMGSTTAQNNVTSQKDRFSENIDYFQNLPKISCKSTKCLIHVTPVAWNKYTRKRRGTAFNEKHFQSKQRIVSKKNNFLRKK